MKQLFFSLFSFIFLISLFAQEKITVGSKYQIFSNTLQENREYWIHLPTSYNDTSTQPAKYPVLYLLDGEMQFQYLVAIQEALSGNFYNYTPEMIIVGVVNTDRTRDFTPTKGNVIHNGEIIYNTSGEANDFTIFLTKELRKQIDNNFRTNGYNLLTGHSFGGLFTIHTLLTKPTLFNAYIANDPSLWWDKKYTYHLAEKNWDSLNFNGRCLYVSMANYDKSKSDKLEHSLTIERFCKEFLSKSHTLRCKWEYFTNEDHGTISLPATYNGLKYFFNGLCLPIKKIPATPSLVTTYYNQVSDSIKFQLLPPETLVAQLANFCIKVNQNQSAKKLLELNIKNYPNSKHAYEKLNELYLKFGDSNQNN